MKQTAATTRPNLYVIAEPNGVGKTTFARKFLPDYADCKLFINADLIAERVSPLAPETAAFHAGRLMLEEIGRYAKRRADFGFESTLAGRSHLSLLRKLKREGYAVRIWVTNSNLTLKRITGHVLLSGHDVPESVQSRRFGRSIRNFFTHYRPLADSWCLFDNSGPQPLLIAPEWRADFTCQTGPYRIPWCRATGWHETPVPAHLGSPSR